MTVGSQRWGCRLVPAITSHALLLVGCALFVCFEVSAAATVVDVYRMIQYDLGGSSFGARKSLLNAYATSGYGNASTLDLARTAILTPLLKLNLTLINQVASGAKLVGGLILTLPPRTTSEGSRESDGSTADDEWQQVAAMEEALLKLNLPMPVYFVEDSSAVRTVLARVKAADLSGNPASATSGGYKLAVALPEGKKVKDPPLINLEAWLYGEPSTAASSASSSSSTSSTPSAAAARLPIIAITASYDTFGAAPAAAVGADSNASGVAALLELLRLFSLLYARLTPRPPFNLLFLLSSGGPFNFDGTRQWLSGLDQQVVERIELAISLNSLGGQEGASPVFHLHASRSLKDPTVRALFEDLNATATSSSLAAVSFVHKKINVSDSRVAWEHEHFSRRKVPAATLSSLPPSRPTALFAHAGGLADSRDRVDDGSVVTAVKLVADAIVKHIFSASDTTPSSPSPSSTVSLSDVLHSSSDFFSAATSLGPSPPYVSHWISLLTEHARVAPFLKPDAPVLLLLTKELELRADKVEARKSILDPQYAFFVTPPAKLQIHQVASVTFDIVTFLAVLAYLCVLYATLHVSTKGLDDFVALFRQKPQRKVKTT